MLGDDDMRRVEQVLALILTSFFLVGCDAISYPPERMVYKPAYAAVKSAQDLPAGAVVDPQHNAKLYIAKNAAQVEMPYEYTDASGKKVTKIYLVYLKRVNRRWELDRGFPLPTYTNNPSINY
jgi:hypothetical protein